MDKKFTLSIFTENSPGVLHRITVMFTRRKINIESLTVSETGKEGISRFTIVIKAERNLMRTIARQLARVIEVIDVAVFEDEELVVREVALIRVTPSDDTERVEVEKIAKENGAQVAYRSDTSLVFEKSGSEAEVDKLFKALRQNSVAELIRSGRIAMVKEGDHFTVVHKY